jgi:Ice-binding-like/Bacterial Ig-like domain
MSIDSKVPTTTALLLLVGVTAAAACGPSGSLLGDGSGDGGTSTEAGTSSGGGASSGGTSSGGTSSGGASSGGTSSGGASSGGSPSEDGGAPIDAATPPAVVSTNPLNGATGSPINGEVSAVFNEPMAPSTLNTTTFTVTSGAAVPVSGTVIYATSKAVFWPTAQLASNTLFTASITAGAQSVAGVPLPAPHTWTFTTGSAAVAGVPVDLGTAGSYAILTKTGISTIATSAITGNLGVSPAAATYITGFSLTADPTNVFSTSAQVTGKLYAADYAAPTPTNLTTAIGDMGTAFTAAAGRAPDVVNLGAGAIGGMTLHAGVYSWGTGLLIPTNVTLTGSATDVWVFQIAQNLTVANGVQVVLAGGALAQNVFWQVSGSASIGTTAKFEGTVLCKTAIALNTGASITGSLLAQTAVTLDACTVVQP